MEQFSIDMRPHKLSEVYGQPAVVKELNLRFKNNKIPKALLLKGRYGCGKTTVSKIFAMMLNCEHLDSNGEPCGVCPVCKDIIYESWSQDTKMLDGGSNGKDDVIAFSQMAQMSPMYNKNSIFIIEEADQLSTAAKNSLLKLLEKPQDNVYFVLLSMNDKGIPSALQSRCQVLKFNPFSSTDIMLSLKSMLTKAGLWAKSDIPKEFYLEGLRMIADASNGSLRSAIQYLDKCINGEFYTPADISSHLGVLSTNTVHEILMEGCSLKKEFFNKIDSVDIDEFITLGNTLVASALKYRITKQADNEYYEAQTAALSGTRYLVDVAQLMNELVYSSFVTKAVLVSKFSQLFISKKTRTLDE